MLLLRRRKSDHSPLFFCESTASVLYSPPTASVYYRAHFHRERSSQEERWNGEGREKGVFGGGRGFFSRGESLYMCIRPCFWGSIHVCGEKRKGLYIHPPKPDLIFRRRCAELITGNPYFSPPLEKQNNRGIGDLQ